MTSTLQLESSVAQRITRLTAALGDPFGEDPRLAPYKTSLDDTDRGQSHLRRRRLKDEFLSRVDAFLAAHEIALSIITKRSPRSDWGNVTSRAAWLFNVESIRRGHVRTMTGLRDLETAFFTSWNEGPPAETREFWKAVQHAALPYIRRDLLAEIFNRRRIPSRADYEFAVDIYGVAQDESLLHADQVEQLVDGHRRTSGGEHRANVVDRLPDPVSGKSGVDFATAPSSASRVLLSCREAPTVKRCH